jgi:hypothetical protein
MDRGKERLKLEKKIYESTSHSMLFLERVGRILVELESREEGEEKFREIII